jgi:hypothetical protein
MRTFTLVGSDAIDGKPVEMTTQAATVQDADRWASLRSIKVEAIRDGDGTKWTRGSAGWEPSKSPATGPDKGLMLLCGLIPIVGLAVGVIRLSTDRSHGPYYLLAAFLGAVVYVLAMAR